MSDNSKIAWTEATWNPVSGCTKVSEGCRNCYAERDWPRLSKIVPAYTGRSFEDVACHFDRLDQPLRWRRPRKIFVNSMSDLFHPDVPESFIDRVFGIMALCCQTSRHAFQILTKRPERMRDYLSQDRREKWAHFAVDYYGGDPGGFFARVAYREEPLPNVWLGVSVEDQESADERIPLLIGVPAAVRWVSIEPMIGPVDFKEVPVGMFGPLRPHGGTGQETPKLDWVVVGGESGPNARPMEDEWVRKIVYACERAHVPLFVKQLGAAYSDPVDGIAGASLKIPEEAIYLLKRRLKHRSGADPEEWPEGLRVREWPIKGKEAICG